MTTFKLTHGIGHTYNIGFAVNSIVGLLQDYNAYRGGSSSEDGIIIFSTLTEKDEINDIMRTGDADGIKIEIVDIIQKHIDETREI